MWKLLPLQYQLAAEFGIVLVVSLGLAWVHHHIYQQGWDAAMARVAAQDAARVNQAHIDSVKIGEKHEKIRMHIRAQVGYAAPASPLVAERVRSYSAAGTDRRVSGMRGSASSGSHH